MSETMFGFFFFSSRRRHTRLQGDWSSDVCSSDLYKLNLVCQLITYYWLIFYDNIFSWPEFFKEEIPINKLDSNAIIGKLCWYPWVWSSFLKLMTSPSRWLLSVSCWSSSDGNSSSLVPSITFMLRKYTTVFLVIYYFLYLWWL